jgi:hypothetical protein
VFGLAKLHQGQERAKDDERPSLSPFSQVQHMSIPTKKPGVNSYLLPPFRDIVFIALFVIAAWHGPGLFNKDGDLGRHITIGQYILDTRTIPIRDVFSHTRAGERLVPHEWLADVMFGAAFKVMGLGGDVLLTAYSSL